MNKKQRTSITWKQLDRLDADTCASQGWFAESVERSPALGYRMQLRNPAGELVAWGWSTARMDTASTVLKAQAAYAKVRVS